MTEGNETTATTTATTATAVSVDSVLYYYGNISRETAEWILWDRGCQDGMYLLRESNSDYVLSLCYQKGVLHYRIKRLPSGEVGLHGVPRQTFLGPVELVEGVEGLACKPTIPCNKSLGSVLPPTHWGVTEEEVRNAMIKKARDWGIDEAKLDSSLTEDYNDIKLLITKTLHEIQPWFHGPMSRIAAERRIEETGHKDGKFLVRERDDSSYALCLSHSGRIKHYKIDVLPSGEFAIQDGQRFPSIMALVSHYTLFRDGLWCALTEPCPITSRRPNDNSLSSSSRSSRSSNDGIGNSENRTKNNVCQSPGSSDRNKSINGVSSGAANNNGTMERSATPTKSNKFFMPFSQRGFFTKLVAAVAPQIVTQNGSLPPNHHHSNISTPHTSPPLPRLYPSLSDDSLESGDSGGRHVASPSAIHSPPGSSHTPPYGRRMHNQDRENGLHHDVAKRGKMQKASSFDMLPGFLSALFLGDASDTSDKKNKRRSMEITTRRAYSEGESPSVRQKPLETVVSPGENKPHRPVPAPRLSLARKSLESAPVYANREVLVTTGRSVSLGETASDPIPEGDECHGGKTDGQSPGQMFIRSASSPSVVSQPCKLKPQPPPRSPHLPVSPESASSSTEFPLHCSDRTTAANGAQKSVSPEFRPIPWPRKKLSSQVENTDSSNNATTTARSLNNHHHDDSSSSTLTETSESRNCSPIEEPLYAEIDPSLIIEREPCNTSVLSSKPLTSPGSGTTLCNGVIASTHRPKISPHSSRNSSVEHSDDGVLQSPVLVPKLGMSLCDTAFEILENMENPLYATLSVANGTVLSSPEDDERSDDFASHLPQSPANGSKLPVNLKRTLSREESENAYRTLRRIRRGPVTLDPKSITLKEKIGSGNFGEVLRGVFQSGPLEVQFAVKMLKNNTIPNQKSAMVKEAQLMAALDHPHIVRLIGVCEGDPLMLVMELAPLGPLNKYLKQNRDMSVQDILLLMLQVAMAMEYLESRQFVHRDLAARNVLLVNESFAKISDFGMSRALGLGKDYYKAEVAGKWPLKWYAPECIYYFKFSTKSDVWSFGVTLWEALSYGEKPYQGMVGREILQMFERNERLSKPEKCPPAVYDIMWKCWQYNPDERPTFSEVYCTMKTIIGSNR